MPYNFAADSFHTKKLCSRLSSSEVRFFTEIGRRFAIIGKRVVDFLPVSINWTFLSKCYGWGATSDHWFKIGDFAPTGAGWPKISGRSGRPPPTILLRRELGLNDLSYGVKISTDLSTVLSQFMRVTDGQTDGRTDGRTDRQTDRETDRQNSRRYRPRLHSMQRGKNETRS